MNFIVALFFGIVIIHQLGTFLKDTIRLKLDGQLESHLTIR